MIISVDNCSNMTESYKEGLVAIWWYTDDGNFWDFTKTLDNAENDYGYLQYSTQENHMTLWKKAVTTYVEDKKLQEMFLNKGYKSIERGRVVFNIRTQCYEVICSKELVNNTTFRNACLDHFNLHGNRVDFEDLPHYHKVELTGNAFLDSGYYDF